MKGRPADFSALLRSLTVDQLRRLDAALTAANGGTVNIRALIEGMLATPAPEARHSENRKSEIDGGRAYELSLDCSDLGTARAQYEAEWERAEGLVLGGMSYEEAWAQIRKSQFAT
jgi:hypothetical protein